jgi:plasmid stability protein
LAVLNIRNLPDDVHAKLRVRAAKAGRSIEAEARAILTAACTSERDLAAALELTLGLPDWVDEVLGEEKPDGVVDSLIAERRAEGADS